MKNSLLLFKQISRILWNYANYDFFTHKMAA